MSFIFCVRGVSMRKALYEQDWKNINCTGFDKKEKIHNMDKVCQLKSLALGEKKKKGYSLKLMCHNYLPAFW